MGSRIRLTALVACTAALGLLSLPAGADGQITASGTKSGTNATVTGTVAFPTISGPQSVGGENTAFANTDVATATGIDITDAKIEPLADGSGLRFIIHTADMPEAVIPELVRYNWSFAINGVTYQLQAKKTNLASVTTTEDPVGHIQQAAAQKEFFQLRGACVTSYEGLPLAGCYHLRWLTGSFDLVNNKVTMELPFNARDEIGRLVAEHFKPGATLIEFQNAGTSIAGCFQAVAGTSATCDFINGWTPYYIGGQLHAAVGPKNQDPAAQEYTQAVTVNGGSFSTSVSGLSASNNTVYLRACNGATCAYGSVVPA